MALPILSALVGAASNTVKGIVLGGIKNGLKNAAKRSLAEVSKEALSSASKEMIKARATNEIKEGLNRFISGKFTDAQALVLNRLKHKPTRALYDLAAKEFKLPQQTIRSVIKHFNPSQRAQEIAKGRTFTKILGEATKRKALSALPGEIKTIRQLLGKPRLVKDRIVKVLNKYAGLSINEKVLKKLEEMQYELKNKVFGRKGATDAYNNTINIDIDILQYYTQTRLYTESSIRALETIQKRLTINFVSGSDLSDVWVIDDGEGDSVEWSVYSNADVRRFVYDFKSDVEHFLDLTSKPTTTESEQPNDENSR